MATHVVLASAALSLLVQPVDAEQVAKKQQRLGYNIPSQPLDKALLKFTAASGLQLVARGDQLRGKLSTSVSGPMSRNEALDRLLAGTGYGYAINGNTLQIVEHLDVTARTYSVMGDVTELDPIIIEAEGESPWGPVNGVVAKRAASGSKTDTPILEIPQTVNVVTRDEINQRGAETLDQVLRYTPGVMSQIEGGATHRDAIYARGFLASQFLDGIPVAGTSFIYGSTQIEPYALERVEVLKGPASNLYGRNSPGGLVNMITKRPTEEPLREVELQGGSFDRIQGAFDFSGALDPEEKLLYRMTGLFRDSGTQFEGQPDDRYFIAPALTWRPDEDTSLTILASFQKDNTGAFEEVPLEGSYFPNPLGRLSRDRSYGEPDREFYHREQASIGYIFDHRFNDNVSVRQNVRFQQTREDLIFVNSLGLLEDMRTLERYATSYGGTTRDFAIDTSARIKFDSGRLSHTLLLGVDYNLATLVDAGSSLFPEDGFPSIDIFDPVYGQPFEFAPRSPGDDANQQQVGIYAQDQIRYDDWLLTLGLRHDWTDLSSQYGGAESPLNEVTDNALTGRIGLTYLFDNGLAPYVSYSESFQPVLGTDADGNLFKPTTGQQYEIGLKYEPNGWNGFIGVSAFHITQQNVLTQDPRPEFEFEYIQTGEIEVTGVEVEAKVTLNEQLDLIAAYAYLDGEITESNVAGETGNAPQSIPKHQASLWAYYTVSESAALGGLSFGAGVRYTGEYFSQNNNNFPVGNYMLVDAALRYDLGVKQPHLKGLSLDVNATNVFNTAYITAAGYSAQYGQARTINGSLKYKW